MDLVRIVVTVESVGFEVAFTSEPMDRYHADMTLMELAGKGQLEVLRARLIPADLPQEVGLLTWHTRQQSDYL